MTPKKILVLGATIDANNRGIGALTAGAVTILRHRYPDSEVSLVDYDRVPGVTTVTVQGKDVAVPLINLRFSKQLLLQNNIAFLIVLTAALRMLGRQRARLVIERNGWLKRICEADFAVAVSGGDSFSDIYGLGRFFYMSLPQVLIVMLGKRLVLLPQTIGPFRHRLSRVVARYVMRHADAIYSRDRDGITATRALIAATGDPEKVRFCYDMGFALEPARPEVLDLGGLDMAYAGIVIGLNVSGLLHMGGYSRKNMFGLKMDYRELIEGIVRFLIESKGVKVLLVPHVFGNEEESDVTANEAVFDALHSKYPAALFCVRGTYDPGEIKYVIGLTDMFIGSRMHACIAALSQAIPAVGIAYSRKFIGVLESVGLAELVADPRSLTTDETIGVIERVFEGRKAIAAHLRRTMPAVKRQVIGALDGLNLARQEA